MSISAVSAALVCLLTVWRAPDEYVLSAPVRRAGGVWYVESVSERIVREAQRWNIPAALLAARLYRESGLDPRSRRNRAGRLESFGLGHFHARSRWGRTVRARCRETDYDTCLDIQVEMVAWLLSEGLRSCGSKPGALAWYISGRCEVSPGGVEDGVRRSLRTEKRIEALGRLFREQGKMCALPVGGAGWRMR